MVNEVKQAARNVGGCAREAACRVLGSRPVKAVVAAGVAVFAAGKAMAQTAPDPTTITTSATTAATAVETLVVGVVGFFVLVKVVKWIRK